MRYRLIDTAGSELGIVDDERGEIAEDDTVLAPDGSLTTVVEVYDDEEGKGATSSRRSLSTPLGEVRGATAVCAPHPPAS